MSSSIIQSRLEVEGEVERIVPELVLLFIISSQLKRFFFVFQAEDGIRDWSVTGVQTCALPISILLVTHDNRILDIADRIIYMEDGRLSKQPED